MSRLLKNIRLYIAHQRRQSLWDNDSVLRVNKSSKNKKEKENFPLTPLTLRLYSKTEKKKKKQAGKQLFAQRLK